MRLLQNDTFRAFMIVLAFLLGFVLTGALFLHPHECEYVLTGGPISSGTAGQVSK